MSAFLHPKLRDLSGHFLKFFIGELREPLQLTHKGIKRLLYITLAFVVAGAAIAIAAFISKKWVYI